MEIDLIELILEGKGGNEFQNYCERYLKAIYGSDFHQVASSGPEGDGGKDGYCSKTKEYFAISSRKDVATKIRSDLNNCLAKNYPVRKFIYITNREIKSSHWHAIDKLQMLHPDLEIEVKRHTDVAREIVGFPKRQIESILARSINFEEDSTVYFEEQKDKEVTFSFSQAIKDSCHYYLMITGGLGIMGLLFYYLDHNRWTWSVAMTLFFFLFVSYMYLNRKSLSKTKHPHKILHLITSGKLPVGEETLFMEPRIMIRRNSAWNFTFKRRNVACIKKGCSGHVYLYNSEEYTYIGKCDKDKITHLYKVDSNFYGELL
ncbi:hypothetical protein [Chryseobacterium scophthalmum]|uniref:hypothetical protein n=1 Tax=Chryseobacterium scophthalmum TaxID=59733 RepID=UPI003D090740